jgi:Cu(I)/Ag(I) efflux system membrane fusion protein
MKYSFIPILVVLLTACSSSSKKEDPMEGMDMGQKQNVDAIVLNEQQMVLGNIQVDTIHNGIISDRTILTATLNIDQTKINTISSRVMGRIERLYFKNLGDFVRKGDKVMDIYSEELNTAKQEYLLALEKRDKINNPLIDFTAVVQSAKNKLLLWGVTEEQIKELERSKNTSVVTSFYSLYSGFIISLQNREGEYTPEGGMILKLANLSTLWAEAQVYSSQMSIIKGVNTATVLFPDIPGFEVKGDIQFVNPEITQQTRLNLLRVTIPNADNRLKPGMPAYVYLKAAESISLTLPSDAVIRNANSNVVWVQTAYRTFEGKMVQLGLQEDDRVQILSGLKDGDVVVTSGAYLINSESAFKKGGNVMEGMKM